VKTPEELQAKRLEFQHEHEIAMDPPVDHSAGAYSQGWINALHWLEEA
jgi:hypothetical protein